MTSKFSLKDINLTLNPPLYSVLPDILGDMSPFLTFLLLVSALVTKALNNHELYCKAFPDLDFCQETLQRLGITPLSSTSKPSIQSVVCHDTSKDVCACGQPRCDTNEISGGKEAKPHQYPWIVRLVGECVGPCGGTLVSPRVILSAFHCTTRWRYNTESCDQSEGKRLAVLGRHKILPHRMSSYKTIPVTKVFTPPNAPLDGNDYKTHDFSLLLLKHPAKYSSKVSPICLPEPHAEFGGMKATAAGWGRTDKPSVNKKQSPVLKSVDLTVDPMEYKHKKMFGTKVSMKENQYQDPCTGDSGGPLMYYNKTTSRYVLIGTVYGAGYDCRTDKVSKFEGSENGVWNKVSAHMEWIKDTMEELGETVCKADSG